MNFTDRNFKDIMNMKEYATPTVDLLTLNIEVSICSKGTGSDIEGLTDGGNVSW